MREGESLVGLNLALHECVFKSVPAVLSRILHSSPSKAELLSAQDKHGNTPLHLAVMMGKREHIHLLLAHGAKVKVKNKQGWSPLAEAVRCVKKDTLHASS